MIRGTSFAGEAPLRATRRHRLVVLFLALLLPSGAMARAESLVSFVHVTTADNRTGSTQELTRLDHPLLDDHPDARLLVTQNWNPPGHAGTYNFHEVGVTYSSYFKKWYILNEDEATMPLGAAFNVLILGDDALAFVHLTTDLNSSGRASVLHPSFPTCLLCPPGAILLYTHTYTSGGLGGGSFDHHSSVIYGSPVFALITESENPSLLDPMPTGVLFNVLVAKSPDLAASAGWAFKHFAAAETTAYDYTVVTHPELDGRRAAVFFAVRGGSGSAAQISPHPIGVFYGNGHWSIFFEDLATMIDDSVYNLYVPPLMSDSFESGDTGWWTQTVP